MDSSADAVGSIHRRFYLTLINPSSYKTSLAIAVLCIASIAYLSTTGIEHTLITIPVAYMLFRLDYLLLKRYPVAKMSKVYHTNAFAILLWLVILAISIALYPLTEGKILLIEGMASAIGLRISIFTSVFGSPLRGSIPIAVIAPLVILLVIAYNMLYSILLESIIYSILISALAIAWCILADRAGKPYVDSTFRLLQAYLLAWTDNDAKAMEAIMEGKAYTSRVGTKMLRLQADSRSKDTNPNPSSNLDSTLLLLPDIHPGPFYPVGGSNLPYDINIKYKNAVTLHSISDHSLNLPSRSEVTRYLASLDDGIIIDKGYRCTEPINMDVNNASVTAIAFGRVAMLILSSKNGMEDIPMLVRYKVEEYARLKGFKDVMLVDTHDSMGKHLSSEEVMDMVEACKNALDQLAYMEQYDFKIGFSSMYGNGKSDIGPAGLYSCIIHVNNSALLITWVDANNALNGIREHIIEGVRRAMTNDNNGNNNSRYHIVLCTSDTHATSGKARNLLGYFPLGSITSKERLVSMLAELSRNAYNNARIGSYEVAYSSAEVKVMGYEQFEHYAKALDRSLRITKVFIAVTTLSVITMLLI